MSAEGVATAPIDSVARRDLGGVLAVCHPAVEVISGLGHVAGPGKTCGLPLARELFCAIEVRAEKIVWLDADFEPPSALRVLADRIEAGV